jgi:hypothetical protein
MSNRDAFFKNKSTDARIWPSPHPPTVADHALHAFVHCYIYLEDTTFGYRSNSPSAMMMEMLKFKKYLHETKFLPWPYFCIDLATDTGMPLREGHRSNRRSWVCYIRFLHSGDIRLYSTARGALMFQKLTACNTLNHLLILRVARNIMVMFLRKSKQIHSDTSYSV